MCAWHEHFRFVNIKSIIGCNSSTAPAHYMKYCDWQFVFEAQSRGVTLETMPFETEMPNMRFKNMLYLSTISQ